VRARWHPSRWPRPPQVRCPCYGDKLSQLDLERHGARTPAGVFTRVAQRLLVMAAGIWHNWETGVTSKSSLIAFDH